MREEQGNTTGPEDKNKEVARKMLPRIKLNKH